MMSAKNRLQKTCAKTSSLKLAHPAILNIAVNMVKSANMPKLLLMPLLCLLIVSCSTTPVILPTTPAEPEPAIGIEEPATIAHPLQENKQIITIDKPWELVARSKVVADRDAPALLIRAINEFIRRDQNGTAQSLTGTLATYALTFNERVSLQIIRARLAAATTEHERVIELLSTLDYKQIEDIELKKQAFTVLSDSQIALGHLLDAVATLLNIERWVSYAEQLENQQTIVRLLQTMNALQRTLLREQSPNSAIGGWLALADIIATTTPERIHIKLEIWRQVYPNHPAQPQLIAQYVALSKLDEYQQIALLLPLTSAHGAAARAFYDGFMQAHRDNISLKPPRVVPYDVGEEPYLSSLYYQAAVNSGADFVVGPLGREAADALLSSQPIETATLLIAEVPVQHIADNLFGISLSPEQEARQTADKAFADGHRQAATFHTRNQWGERVANAFIEQWQSLGATIIKNESFPSEISDYSRVIQTLLGLDKSIIRKRSLETKINAKLTFTARRNDDVDMIFLAANAEQSRLIVPQLRFFQAHDLPLYATSYVYSGNPNPIMDADLDGLIFGDMRWMLEDVARYKADIAAKQALAVTLQAQPEATSTAADGNGLLDGSVDPAEQVSNQFANPAINNRATVAEPTHGVAQAPRQEPAQAQHNPYEHSALNRLYALGIQSYQIIPRLNLLRSKTLTHFFGRAMTVSIDQAGRVVRLPLWAKFVSGLAQPLDRPLQLGRLTIDTAENQPLLKQN